MDSDSFQEYILKFDISLFLLNFFFIQEGIDAAISGRVSSKSAQNVLPSSQPLNRGRRAHGSGREERPGTASRFALR